MTSAGRQLKSIGLRKCSSSGSGCIEKVSLHYEDAAMPMMLARNLKDGELRVHLAHACEISALLTRLQ